MLYHNHFDPTSAYGKRVKILGRFFIACIDSFVFLSFPVN